MPDKKPPRTAKSKRKGRGPQPFPDAMPGMRPGGPQGACKKCGRVHKGACK
jgi:hypothetical protein